MTNRTNRTQRIDLVALVKQRYPGEAGWVVHSPRRGGYVCEPDASSAGRMVGLSDLDGAQFFTNYDDAARRAYWQSGIALRAIRTPGGIRLQN
jgi:hypothetical protein